jgi:hypothetical protein
MVSMYVINTLIIHSLLWFFIRLVWSVMQVNKMFVNNSNSMSSQRKHGVAVLHSNPVTWNIDVHGIFKFCVVVDCKTCFVCHYYWLNCQVRFLSTDISNIFDMLLIQFSIELCTASYLWYRKLFVGYIDCYLVV